MPANRMKLSPIRDYEQKTRIAPGRSAMRRPYFFFAAGAAAAVDIPFSFL